MSLDESAKQSSICKCLAFFSLANIAREEHEHEVDQRTIYGMSILDCVTDTKHATRRTRYRLVD